LGLNSHADSGNHAEMILVIKIAWKAVLALLLVMGIIYLPADIGGVAEAYPGLARAFGMLDRVSLLVAVAVILVLYILWMDVRPYVRRWFLPSIEKTGKECRELADEIFSEKAKWDVLHAEPFFAIRDEQGQMAAMDRSSRAQRQLIAIMHQKFGGRVQYNMEKLRSLGVAAPLFRSPEYHIFQLATFLSAVGSALEAQQIDIAKAYAVSFEKTLHD
jgi:hypothetical protein